MTREAKCAWVVSAPYVVWMALMLVLPATPAAYAVRTAAAACALAVAAGMLWRTQRADFAAGISSWAWGLAAGLLVLALWVWPESLAWYRRWCIVGEGGTARVDAGAAGLKAVRLLGSALVIAPAEELFFRHFLYRRLQSREWCAVPSSRFDLSAFLWTTGLFALEHDRVVAAALAGAVYLFVYLRRGLFAAVLAHVVTNLALGLYVLRFGAWQFW